MRCLGLEGTAHTLGIGVVDDRGTVLANQGAMYRPAAGGIHPREAANHHADHLRPLLRQALEEAGVGLHDLDLIAFSQGPGLGPSLRTVATAARALALALDLPLVGVNHCIAHVEIGRAVTPAEDPVLLYLSGGNTQVISYAAGRYRVFGETLDIGLGNLLDKVGRTLGFPFPAGPEIERQAQEGTAWLPLPYSVKGMDVAFSGILTAAEALHAKGAPLPDLCFSLQETTYAMVTEVAER
ncbi:MAG: tRNA (adenosine(37)-N6)-threonylcarbamoyltransferase complex transferase subunit TsaD, partial [Thermoplasmata archaeon]|nr:tRNA (adenosine(37)-N6)-threonylcarbamoyltransferase complex transferase subunit TsaD [Thermoplasmata archaeon]